MTPPSIHQVTPSALVLHGPQCMPEGLSVQARLGQDPSGIADVTLRYRLVGELPNQEAGWFETALDLSQEQDDELTFLVDLPTVGAEAMNLFDDGHGALEFQVLGTDGAGNQAAWPANDPHSVIPVSPCDLMTDLEIVDGELTEQFAGYGPGCSPTSTTLGLTLANPEHLQKAYAVARWYTGEYQGDHQAASDAFEILLAPAGPSDEVPGAEVYQATVDIEQGGNAHLGGQDGFLAWRLFAKDVEGGVDSWPMGDPPPVFIEACALDLAPPATPTPTLGAITLPSATPTIGPIAIAPTATTAPGPILGADVVQASGSGVTLYHEQSIDLDSGTVGPGATKLSDLRLAGGDDPYLDDLAPLNGSYIGFYGAGPQPAKQNCINTLKSVSPTTIQWPGHKDAYYCYETAGGRTGWLRVRTYVSQPFHERRLIFDFTTYK